MGHFTWSEVSTQSYFARCFYRCTKVLRVSPRNSGWTNSCIASYCQLLSQTFQTFPNLPISFHLFSVFPHHIFSFLILGSLGKPVLDASTHLPVTRSQPPSLGFHPVPCPEKKRPIQTYSIYSCFLIFLIFLFILLKLSLLNLSRGPCLSC